MYDYFNRYFSSKYIKKGEKKLEISVYGIIIWKNLILEKLE